MLREETEDLNLLDQDGFGEKAGWKQEDEEMWNVVQVTLFFFCYVFCLLQEFFFKS